jgi:hypothetical protein
VLIELDGAHRVVFRVDEMLADTQGHGRAQQMRRPGPRPTREQIEAWHTTLPGIRP